MRPCGSSLWDFFCLFVVVLFFFLFFFFFFFFFFFLSMFDVFDVLRFYLVGSAQHCDHLVEKD